MTDSPKDAATMRLRPEPPRVTRLSRRMLAGVAAVALLGIGGALIYALQTRAPGDDGKELYSTANRPPADGLTGLPRDYTGPVLGPPLPGDLGRPILDAQNKGQPVVPPTITTPTVDEAEQRRRAEDEAARTSTVFFQSRAGSAAAPTPGLAGFDLAGQPGQSTAQDRQLAFLNAAVDRRIVAPDRIAGPASPFVLQTGERGRGGGLDDDRAADGDGRGELVDDQVEGWLKAETAATTPIGSRVVKAQRPALAWLRPMGISRLAARAKATSAIRRDALAVMSRTDIATSGVGMNSPLP